MTNEAAAEADHPAETEMTASAEVAADTPAEPAPAASDPVVSMPVAESQLDIAPAGKMSIWKSLPSCVVRLTDPLAPDDTLGKVWHEKGHKIERE